MCYVDRDRPPAPPIGGGSGQAQDLVLTAADANRFAAYEATPSDPNGAQILIFPDVRGLHGFYKALADRFAEQGIRALAMDYFGRTAGLDGRDDAFEYMPHVQQMHFDTFQADVDAALAHLRAGAGSGQPTFTVGFCMGGTLSFLNGTLDHDLAGVIGFYAGMSRDFGSGMSLPDAGAAITSPALGLFGGADQGIPPEKVAAFDEALDGAGVPHEVITYPGAPHSFFDRKYAEFADACADAWTRVLGFVAAHTA